MNRECGSFSRDVTLCFLKMRSEVGPEDSKRACVSRHFLCLHVRGKRAQS